MIRTLKQSDRIQLENIVAATESFSKDEQAVAMELIDTALQFPQQRDYHIYVYDDGALQGYYCAGQRPLTDAVYDLYWIVVAPSSKGKGVGSQLLLHAENFVKGRSGRLLLAETSSKDDYQATRKFYERHQYRLLASIPDFYKRGDDLQVFGKYLQE